MSCGLSGWGGVAGVKGCLGGVNFQADLGGMGVFAKLLEEVEAGILGADVFIVGVLGG